MGFEPTDRDLLVAAWDASTAKPARVVKSGMGFGWARGNLSRFAVWAATEFDQARVCEIMDWSTTAFDRLTSTGGFELEGSTAPRRWRGGKGKASESARAWNDYGGGLSEKRFR